MEPYWAVAQTVPNQERQARTSLERRRFDVELPMVEEPCIRRGRRDKRESLVFPGYIFVKIADWFPTRDVWGVQSLVLEHPTIEEGAEQFPVPARVPAGYVESLRAIMNESGYLRLPPKHKFKSGQRVRVNEMTHSFYGLEGLYEGQSDDERARVLFDLMGRKVPTMMSERDLIAA